VKISVDCDSQDTASMTPFDSHLLCAATDVQTLYISASQPQGRDPSAGRRLIWLGRRLQ